VPSPTLRPARAGDVDAVLDLWRRAAENASRPPDHRDAVEAVIARDPGALIVAEAEGGALAGTVIAGFDGWRCHLYRLAVDPGHRRQGLGRALLFAAEARLRALGARRIDAMVLDGNDLGQAIWAAAGYARQDDWSRWVKMV
jgi:ribosomal protein S18 acetylase RimI-like enzyme